MKDSIFQYANLSRIPSVTEKKKKAQHRGERRDSGGKETCVFDDIRRWGTKSNHRRRRIGNIFRFNCWNFDSQTGFGNNVCILAVPDLPLRYNLASGVWALIDHHREDRSVREPRLFGLISKWLCHSLLGGGVMLQST